MADPLWVTSISLQGGTLHNKASLGFVLEYQGALTPMTFVEAVSAASQVAGALGDVTDATISSVKLTYVVSSDGSMPAGTVDTADEAVVMCHVNPSGQLPKFVSVRIPAPKVAEVFLPDGETVDVSEATLVQYIQQLSQHTFLSDGEQINTSEGTDGMAYGYKRSRAKKYN